MKRIVSRIGAHRCSSVARICSYCLSVGAVFFPAIAPVFAMYVKMMLAMGLVFEMPTAVFFLARIGLVTAGFLLKQFKYAVLVIFVAAAILTPGTDVVSQSMMAGPMIGLYILSIGIAWLVAKKKPSASDDADV